MNRLKKDKRINLNGQAKKGQEDKSKCTCFRDKMINLTAQAKGTRG